MPRSRSSTPARRTAQPVSRSRSTPHPASGAGADEAATRILQAARRHFFQLGFARFTMDDLAAELGMSKKTLYRHYRSKDALLNALIDLKAAGVRAGFDALLARTDVSFVERVMLVIRHIHDEVGEISAVFLRDLQRFAPASYKRLEMVRSSVMPAVFQRLLTEGVAAGAIRRDVDVVLAAQLILVAIQALLQPASLERLRLAPHQVAERFIDIVFAGLLTATGQKAYENNRPTF